MVRVYVDANVFLNPILYEIEENSETALANSFLLRIINREVEAYTSFLTWDEFVWVIRRNFDNELAINKGKEF